MLQGRSNVYRKGKKFHVLLMKDAGRAFVRNIALIPCNIYLFLFLLLLFVFLLPKTNNKKTKTKQKSLHVSTFKFQTRNAAQDFFTVSFSLFRRSISSVSLCFSSSVQETTRILASSCVSFLFLSFLSTKIHTVQFV